MRCTYSHRARSHAINILIWDLDERFKVNLYLCKIALEANSFPPTNHASWKHNSFWVTDHFAAASRLDGHFDIFTLRGDTAFTRWQSASENCTLSHWAWRSFMEFVKTGFELHSSATALLLSLLSFYYLKTTIKFWINNKHGVHKNASDTL